MGARLGSRTRRLRGQHPEFQFADEVAGDEDAGLMLDIDAGHLVGVCVPEINLLAGRGIEDRDEADTLRDEEVTTGRPEGDGMGGDRPWPWEGRGHGVIIE